MDILHCILLKILFCFEPYFAKNPTREKNSACNYYNFILTDCSVLTKNMVFLLKLLFLELNVWGQSFCFVWVFFS